MPERGRVESESYEKMGAIQCTIVLPRVVALKHRQVGSRNVELSENSLRGKKWVCVFVCVCVCMHVCVLVCVCKCVC